MKCEGLNNNNCIARNMENIRDLELFCALCPAEEKIVKIADIKRPVKCSFGKYTDRPFTGCKTCGGVTVECQNEKQWPKKRNSKTCNLECKYFQRLQLQINLK